MMFLNYQKNILAISQESNQITKNRNFYLNRTFNAKPLNCSEIFKFLGVVTFLKFRDYGMAKTIFLMPHHFCLVAGKAPDYTKSWLNKQNLAVEVACSIYEFFDRGLFSITVYPKNMSDITQIEQIINLEILELQKKLIADWEMESVKQRAQVDFTTLLEDTEKQAAMIGNLYLATKDEYAFEKYMENIQKLDKKQVQNFFIKYFSPATLHAGYLYPILETDKPKLHKFQAEADEQEAKLLQKFTRTTQLEDGKWINKIREPTTTKI